MEENGEQKDLPLPQTDLSIPEKEIVAKTDLASQGLALRGYGPKWLKLGIIAIVLLILLGGIYTLGRNSVFKELNPSSPIIPPKSPVVYEGSPTPDPTADWKTYEENGFSFMYPSDWISDKLGSMNTNFYKSADDKSSAEKSGSFFPSYVYLLNLSTSNPLNCQGDCSIFGNPKKITMGGIEVTKYTQSEGQIGSMCACNSIKILFSINGNYFILGLNGKSGVPPDFKQDPISESDNKIFDQIVSTFKFTDQTANPNSVPTDTSSWKTYTNSNKGVSVNYPTDWKLDSDLPPDTIFQFNNPQFDMPRVSLFRNFAGDWCNGIPDTKQSKIKINEGISADKWDCKNTIAIEFKKNGQEYMIYADRITDNTYATVNEVIDSIKFTN